MSAAVRMAGHYNDLRPGFDALAFECAYQGQELLNPPSVESWHTGSEWIDGGALVRRVNFAAGLMGNTSLPGVRSIIVQLKSQGTLSPGEFVAACLDAIGPLEVSESTHAELLAQAPRRWRRPVGHGSGKRSFGKKDRCHACLDFRFKRLPVSLRHETRSQYSTTNSGGVGMATTKKDPVLVVLQLTGANDYLNTIIPYTNGHYRDNRPQGRDTGGRCLAHK